MMMNNVSIPNIFVFTCFWWLVFGTFSAVFVEASLQRLNSFNTNTVMCKKLTAFHRLFSLGHTCLSGGRTSFTEWRLVSSDGGEDGAARLVGLMVWLVVHNMCNKYFFFINTELQVSAFHSMQNMLLRLQTRS